VTERCEDLDLFFDRELEPEAEQAFRDHLATCTRCQDFLLGRRLEAAVVGDDRDSRPSLDPIPTMGVDGAPPLAQLLGLRPGLRKLALRPDQGGVVGRRDRLGAPGRSRCARRRQRHLHRPTSREAAAPRSYAACPAVADDR
jgi:hypothetical protein